MTNKSKSSFVPVKTWNESSIYVQRLILEQLPISNRVALERVDKNFANLSNDLFRVQEDIPTEWDSFYDSEYPYPRLVDRCPNLGVFNFNRYKRWCKIRTFSCHDLEMLFSSSPNIRRFKNIGQDCVPIVIKYLKDYRQSSYFNDKDVFDFGVEYLSVDEIISIYSLVNYKIKTVNWSFSPSSDEQKWKSLADKLTVEAVETVDRSRFLQSSKIFLDVIKKLLRKPGIKLKSYDAEVDPVVLELLSKCASLKTFKLSLEGVKNSDVKNLFKLKQVKHVDLSTVSMNDNHKNSFNEMTPILTDYLRLNGHNHRSLTISLVNRPHLIHSIGGWYPNLTKLDVIMQFERRDLYLNRNLIDSLDKMKQLKILKLSSYFTQSQYNEILNNHPKLIRFHCNLLEDEEN